jgi:dUTP pyrophosphatase
MTNLKPLSTTSLRRIQVKFQKLHPEARLPKSWTAGAVGYDLHACLIGENKRRVNKIVPPLATVNVPTGLAIELPSNCFAFVTPRSGLGKHSISIANSPGLIDPDYRGEIMILLYNGSRLNYWIEHDQRIAQLIILPITPIDIVEVTELSHTERGAGGFGSTGT